MIRRAIRVLLSLSHSAFGRPRGAPPGDIRILVYHRINAIGRDPTAVRPKSFGLQMEYLSSNFKVIGMRDLSEALKGSETFERAVVLTFDDGYRETLTNAVPVLREFRLPACFFVPTGLIGTSRRIKGEPAGEAFPKMEWRDIEVLVQQGFEVGCHSVNHVSLGKSSVSESIREILGSKTELENRIGRPIRYLAYPFGRPEDIPRSRQVVRVLEDSFDLCLTAYRGPNIFGQVDPLRLHRIPIRGEFGLLEFTTELAGIFDFYNRRKSYLREE